MFPFQLHSTFCLLFQKTVRSKYKSYISHPEGLYFSIIVFPFFSLVEGLFQLEKILNKRCMCALRVKLEFTALLFASLSWFLLLSIMEWGEHVCTTCATEGPEHECPWWKAREKNTCPVSLALLSKHNPQYSSIYFPSWKSRNMFLSLSPMWFSFPPFDFFHWRLLWWKRCHCI